MANSSTGAVLATLDLNPQEGAPLYSQVYTQVREAILAGRLGPGSRLPSTRTLSSTLKLSRNTVLKAFDQLLAEGYVECRVGDGTYVSSAFDRPRDAIVPTSNGIEPAPRPLSRRATRLTDLPAPPPTSHARAFAMSIPALDQFPLDTWNRLLSRTNRRGGRELLIHESPFGYEPLRKAIANYLQSARGLRVNASQVIVLSSAGQGIDIAARLLIDPGDRVLIEEPGSPQARGTMTAAGARITPVAVDARGIRFEAAPDDARLAYVTPSHQVPLGQTLTLERRLALLEWAERRGAWILEDDGDSELRHHGRPLQALQGLDQSGRVLFLGTFARLMFPALRLAFLIAPEDLVEAIARSPYLNVGQCPLLSQATMTEFMEGGHYGSHVRRMRSLYRDRRDRLVKALHDQVGNRFEISTIDSGLHVIVHLAPETDDAAVADRARAGGLEVTPLSSFYHDVPKRRGLVLGFADLDEQHLRANVQALATLMNGNEQRNGDTHRFASSTLRTA